MNQLVHLLFVTVDSVLNVLLEVIKPIIDVNVILHDLDRFLIDSGFKIMLLVLIALHQGRHTILRWRLSSKSVHPIGIRHGHVAPCVKKVFLRVELVVDALDVLSVGAIGSMLLINQIVPETLATVVAAGRLS